MRHRFHSLCPYFAMFPEAFAEKWIGKLTKPNDVVLDPFCGRGTAPFQALLMGRRVIGNDINPVAYCLTRAKTNAPILAQVRRRITVLEEAYQRADWEPRRRRQPEFFSVAYRPETLRQLLYLRDTLRWLDSDVDAMVAALVLGSLHGETSSPSYLSNQMPRTISTKPAYSVRFWREHGMKAPKRDVFAVLRRRASFRYESQAPARNARVLNEDFRRLPSLRSSLPGPRRFAITSPPYFDTTNFEEDQWLRLWLLGGLPRPTYGEVSSDDRLGDRVAYWRLIGDMWRSLGTLLEEKSDVIVRIGMRQMKPRQLVEALEASSVFAGRPTRLVHHETSEIKGRQTNAFRPGSKGVAVEVDCHFKMK